MLNQTSLSATGAMMLAGIVAVCGMPRTADAQVEEIVVTARKKEESLQEVPLSIAAFSGEQMRRRGISNNYDVAAFTPNFNTAKRVGRRLDRPTIRGMANPASRGEANASYFVDGMFVSGTISTATTNSMERVEVLRGPQSAQFGRATFSGAVNYITRKPTDEWAGEFSTRTGTHSDYQAAGWISGPIVPDVLRFLASASWEHYGGQWRNALEPNSAYVPGDPNSPFTKVFDGQTTDGDTSRLGREKTTDVLTKLSFTPFDSTEINVKYNFTRGDDNHYPTNSFFDLNCYVPDDPAEPWYNTSPGTYCGEFKIDGTVNRKNIPDIRNGLRTNGQIIGGLPVAATIAVPAEPGLQRDTHRVLAEWVQDIGGWTSTLRGGYTRDDFNAAYDLDHTEARAVWGLFAFSTKEDDEDYSFEYSIESPADRPVRGKLGVYYYDFENEFVQRSFTGPFAVFSTPPGTFYGAPRIQETENKSVFGGVSVDLADDWSLDFEARWAKDEKSIMSGQLSEVDFALTPITDALSFTNFTPRITLNWQATDEMMFYLLAAKGNKPGGFNAEYFRADVPAEFTRFLLTCTPGDPTPISLPLGIACTQEDKDLLHIAEEEQWTYEAGFKSSWWDRRATANLSVFFIDWINQGLFLVRSVPQIGSAGGTQTTTTVLTNAGETQVIGFELETNFVVNDDLFVFMNYGFNKGEFKKGTNPELADFTGGDGSLAGKETPDSPNHSLVFGFEATSQMTADAEGFLRADFLYESERWTGSSNTGLIGERKTVNARTGLQSDRWTLTFYVRNLLDDDTPTAVLDFKNFGAPVWANGETPNMHALNPALGRDAGMEFQYRFGN